MRALEMAQAIPWAIRPEALEAILAIAAREDISRDVVAAAMHYHTDAVAAKVGPKLDGARTVTVRDGVAILPIEGPIVRYASLFADVSGATSVETLSTDLTQALGDPAVKAILLHVDSPGGEVSGIAEFADRLYAARDQKPITAYVSDLGASAGYWLASAASRIVCAETAALGSIGVVMAVPDPGAKKSRDLEFVSSASPNKRADPTTEGGKAQYQAIVDTLGSVFVGAVARNRGVSVETVASDFGRGGIFIGQQAVAAGLADAVGSFEQTLRDLAEPPAPALPATPPRPARRAAMGMRDKFFAWLDGIEAEASADQEATIVTGNLSTPPSAPSAAPTLTAVATTDEAELKRLRAEIEAQRSTIVRLRDERIAAEALAFADAAIRDEKARPAEREAIVAAYTRAALDDATLNDGAGRTATVAALYGCRPKGSLTREELDPVALQILTQRERTTADKDAPPSEERVNELLGMTALGASVLNGKGH